MTGVRRRLVGLGVLLATFIGAHVALGQPRKPVREAHTITPYIGLHYLPERSRVLAPVPIFITVDGVREPKVWLNYKPFASTRFIRLVMDPREVHDLSASPNPVEGFAAMIPCLDLTVTGAVELFIVVQDENGAEVAHAGTRREPLEVEIGPTRTEPAAFPGEAPPKICPYVIDCYFPELEDRSETRVPAPLPPDTGCASCTIHGQAAHWSAPASALLLAVVAGLRRRPLGLRRHRADRIGGLRADRD